MFHSRACKNALLLVIVLATLVGVCWSGSVGAAVARVPVRELDQESEETRDDTEELSVGPTAGRRGSRRQLQRKRHPSDGRSRQSGWSTIVINGRDVGSLLSLTANGILLRTSPGLSELSSLDAESALSVLWFTPSLLDSDRPQEQLSLDRSQSRYALMDELSHRNGVGSWLRC